MSATAEVLEAARYDIIAMCLRCNGKLRVVLEKHRTPVFELSLQDIVLLRLVSRLANDLIFRNGTTVRSLSLLIVFIAV